MREWTQEELSAILKLLPDHSPTEVADQLLPRMPYRSRESIRVKASRLRKMNATENGSHILPVSASNEATRDIPFVDNKDDPRGHENENLTHERIIAELQTKLAGEQRKNRDLAAKLSAMASRVSGVQEIVQAIHDMTEPVPIQFPLPQRKRSPQKRLQSLGLAISDLHAAQVIPSALALENEFNMHVLACRLWKLLQKVCSWIEDEKARYDIDSLTIALLGDLVNGDIHEKDGGRNETDMPHAARWVAHLLAQFIGEISRLLYVRVRRAPGNHARLNLARQPSSQPTESWDWIVTEWTRDLLRDYIRKDYIEWPDNESWIDTVEIHGRRFALSHGDEIRGWSGFPYYGVWRAKSNRQEVQRLLDEKAVLARQELHAAGIYMLIFGDKHTPLIAPDDYLCNGCVSGINGHGVKRALRPIQPVQLGFKIDKEEGWWRSETFRLDNEPKDHGFVLP